MKSSNLIQSQRPIICLMGPTASGKSKLSLELAQRIPSEIISVDSVLVYRGLNIGTSKPSIQERNTCIHHLIDIREPANVYCAADFYNDVEKLIEAIEARGKIPILVGGTMLYFKVLQQGISSLPQAQPALRKKLLEEGLHYGWKKMHERLASVDPQAASKIKPTDPQRIQRALEVYELTGISITDHWQKDKFQLKDYCWLNFALLPDKELLNKVIEKRFEKMLASGLISEVEQLFKRGDLHVDLPAIRSVGYRQTWQYLEGKISLDEMHQRAIIATRQLAKRQLTWLRSWSPIIPLYSDKDGVGQILATLSRQREMS